MTKEELIISIDELLSVRCINYTAEIYGQVLHQRCKSLLLDQSKIRDKMAEIQLSRDFENDLTKIKRMNLLTKRYRVLDQKICSLIHFT